MTPVFRSTLILAAMSTAAPAVAQVWVPAWYASPQPVMGKDFVLPANLPRTLANRTIVQRVRLTQGGSRVSVVLSNRYGTRPVRIAAATAEEVGRGRSERKLTFGGRADVLLPPGGDVASSPVQLGVEAGQELTITLSFVEEPAIQSFHFDARSTAAISGGETTTTRIFLSGVLVERDQACGTVVALGDSITDGNGTKLDSDTRWTDYLARRVAPRGVSVVNAGISGARLLADGMGTSALARFDDDVLAQPGAKAVILLLGTNDIAWPGTPFAVGASPMTFERLTDGYRLLVDRARTRGIRVIGGTIPPFQDALPGTPMATTYYSVEKDALRSRINGWIRSSGTFDAVVDFDRALRDEKRPARLSAAYDSGDHLHPGAAGNAAMADAIQLSELVPSLCPASPPEVGRR